MLRQPHGSVPANPLLAESLYLAQYIERVGTGIRDMITRCRQAGLPEPQFAVTDGFTITLERRPDRAIETAVAGGTKSALSRHQVEILRNCLEERPLTELMALTERTDRAKFRVQVLAPMLTEGLLELTVPDRPRSSRQKYRLTEKGRALIGRIGDTKAPWRRPVCLLLSICPWVAGSTAVYPKRSSPSMAPPPWPTAVA